MDHKPAGLDQRVLTAAALVLAAIVLLITWVTIKKSRNDSYALLEAQGMAFSEALAQAAENTIQAESFAEYLLQTRYSDLTTSLRDLGLDRIGEIDLVTFAHTHDLMGVYLYDTTAEVVLGITAAGTRGAPPLFVANEVADLFADPEANFVLLTDRPEPPRGPVHYYLEVTPDLSRVIVLAADALYYDDALQQIGIGYLAQKMAQEKGVEYILYQSLEGIVFASRKPGDLVAIESDPFLQAALDGDEIVSRRYEFQGRQVLEIVRPFEGGAYPFGLFRVGISLERFYDISAGFDRQMMILSGTLFVLVLVAMLYLSGRRKRARLSRQLSDMRLVTERIFEQMRTGVAVIDGRGVIRMANEAFEEVFGVRNVRGQTWADAMGDHHGLLRDLQEGDTTIDEREISVQVGGRERRLLVAQSKLGDVEQNRTGVIVVVYDITRLKRYERAALRKERLSEMGNLAAGVAHEIRNPLNAISIAAQRLASEFQPRSDTEQYLAFTRQIRTETSRLNDIITRFLALAREEKKQAQRVDVASLLHDIGALLRVEGERLQVDVVVSAEPDVIVQADPDRLKQVLLNLFNNAKEALDGSSGQVTIAARRDGKTVRITFADNGPGIAREVADRIFAPYYTTKESGTGLGLPTVQRIIADYGGDVMLDGDYTGGARFVVSLPAV
ncbi:MAG: PAS domain S-box protein [candidate division Zixibacteria bacterium]|nr:PAS domain S-box protein [candidate division Zixibacteria bacterium]